jgi:hypothetical protein
VFVDFHVDALAAELYALETESEPLFGCGFAFQLDLATCTDDALPGQSVKRRATQQLGHRSVIQRIASSSCDFAVSRDSSFGDRSNDAEKCGVALLIFAKGIFEDLSLEILRRGRTLHEQNFIRDRAVEGVVCIFARMPNHEMRLHECLN